MQNLLNIPGLIFLILIIFILIGIPYFMLIGILNKLLRRFENLKEELIRLKKDKHDH